VSVQRHIRVQRIRDPKDKGSIHFNPAKSETPTAGNTVVLWISGHVDRKSSQEGIKKKKKHIGILGFGVW
jgi:hypothetical protein